MADDTFIPIRRLLVEMNANGACKVTAPLSQPSAMWIMIGAAIDATIRAGLEKNPPPHKPASKIVIPTLTGATRPN